MTRSEITEFVIDNIRYKNWDFIIGDKNGTIYLQIQFNAADNFTGETGRQYCRKWQLSEFMTPTEIVQTAWSAVQRAELHEAAENFKFKGADIFNRHINVEVLVKVVEGGNYEHRAAK